MQLVVSLIAAILSITFWSKAAAFDGRLVLGRAPWAWGALGGVWTACCGAAFGHSPAMLVGDQLAVFVAMAGAIAFDERRVERQRAARPPFQP
ncbi:MAG: hypothetical protein AAGB93_22560 [Planctomycetota bacterium]